MNDAPVSLTFCTNGPILVRGDLELTDDAGRPIEARRRTIALCRCGASAIRPFCDGSHKLVGFRTTPPARTPAVVFADDEDDSDDADCAASAPGEGGVACR